MAIRSYRDCGTRDIAAGLNSKAARSLLTLELHTHAQRRLAYLAAATCLDDLRAWPGLNLHALTGDRLGDYAIRINRKYRICFTWTGQDASEVEIVDYH